MQTKSIQEFCTNFQIGNDIILKAKCQDEEIHSLDLNNCLSYREDTIITIKPDLLLKEKCKEFKLGEITRKDGAKMLFLQAACRTYEINQVKKNVSVVDLDDFLFFDGKLKCKDMIDERIKEIKKEPIDDACISLEFFNSGLVYGICRLENKIFKESIKIPFCYDNNDIENFNKQFFGFKNDCQLCSSVKIHEIHELSCTCRDEKGRTKKNFVPLHHYIKIENNRLQCKRINKEKNIKISESEEITEAELQEYTVIPSNSMIEVLYDKKDYDEMAKETLEKQKKKKNLVRLAKKSEEEKLDTYNPDFEIHPDKPITEDDVDNYADIVQHRVKILPVSKSSNTTISQNENHSNKTISQNENPSNTKIFQNEKNPLNKKISQIENPSNTKISQNENALNTKISQNENSSIIKDGIYYEN